MGCGFDADVRADAAFKVDTEDKLAKIVGVNRRTVEVMHPAPSGTCVAGVGEFEKVCDVAAVSGVNVHDYEAIQSDSDSGIGPALPPFAESGGVERRAVGSVFYQRNLAAQRKYAVAAFCITQGERKCVCGGFSRGWASLGLARFRGRSGSVDQLEADSVWHGSQNIA